MPKVRRFDIDFIAGLCILHMMWVHAMQLSGLTAHASYQIMTAIAGGYMAWFFFKSGMLYKKTPLKPLIKKLSLKVLLPYAVLCIVALMFEICYGLYSHQLIDGVPFSLSRLFLRLLAHTAPPLNLALWFLPCFFLVQVLFPVLQKKFSVFVIALIAIVFGALFDFFHFYRECFGGNVFFGLFFYCCGIIFKEKQYETKWLISAAIVVVLGIFFPHYISAATNSMHTGFFYPFGMLVFLGKIFLVDRLFKSIPEHKSIIAFIGKNALFCFSLHYFFMALWKIIIIESCLKIAGWNLFIGICVSCTLSLIVTNFFMVRLKIRNFL